MVSAGKLKVLIIAFGHPDNVLSLAYHLSKKVDLTVLFVAFGDRFQRGILDLDLKDVNNELIRDREKISNIFPEEIIKFIGNRFKLWLLKTPSRRFLKDTKFHNFRTIRKCARELSRKKFDIVHFNGTSGFIFYFYFYLSNPRKLWTLHDYKLHSGEEKKTAELLNRIVPKLNITIIQHYKYLKQNIQEAFRLSEEKVKHVYSGSLDIFHAFKPEYTLKQKDYILFFGRISKYKGVELLLKAYSSIEKKSKKLVIAGSGKFWFNVDKYLSDENIIFLNRYIETPELVGLIKNAAFVVTPYLDATHSGVIVTALVFDKPVVATDVDGLGEVIVDDYNGRLVPPRNERALQTTLEELMRDEKKVEHYAENIRQMKKTGELAWKNIVEKQVEIYQGVR